MVAAPGVPAGVPMLKLVIGDKNLSSWSLRPWMLLKHLGLAFEEIRLRLDTQQFRDEIVRYSPARRVPVLLDGERHVWDSLAICEYANELAGGRAWPEDAAARAHARSVSAEMHSGFQAVRTAWSMRAAVLDLHVELGADGRADVARIDEIWRDCRAKYGEHGPWLFGRHSAADAMYAPVVLRFNSYDAAISAESRAYMEFALADPALQEWIRGARHEIAVEGRPSAHA
jgi:glutathione S-transferase